MKRLIASLAAAGLIAAPAFATTTSSTSANQSQAPAKGKAHKNAKKTAKVNKAAPTSSKTSS